jgi:hypothetical protein
MQVVGLATTHRRDELEAFPLLDIIDDYEQVPSKAWIKELI